MPNIYFLSNITISFSRTLGAKDKTKRNNTLRNIGIGLGTATLAGAGIYAALKRKRLINKNTIEETSKVIKPEPYTDSTIQKAKEIEQQVNNNIAKSNNSKRITTSIGNTSTVKNANRKTGVNKKVRIKKTTGLQAMGNPNVFRRQLNNSYSVWDFSSANFSRRKGSKDKVKRMSKLGAATRIGIAAGLGSVVSGGFGTFLGGVNYKKGALIGATLGGLTGGGMSYLEQKKSPYSPIGKKKWKDYPVKNPAMYGIPLNKLPKWDR